MPIQRLDSSDEHMIEGVQRKSRHERPGGPVYAPVDLREKTSERVTRSFNPLGRLNFGVASLESTVLAAALSGSRSRGYNVTSTTNQKIGVSIL